MASDGLTFTTRLSSTAGAILSIITTPIMISTSVAVSDFRTVALRSDQPVLQVGLFPSQAMGVPSSVAVSAGGRLVGGAEFVPLLGGAGGCDGGPGGCGIGPLGIGAGADPGGRFWRRQNGPYQCHGRILDRWPKRANNSAAQYSPATV
jgi:hypothetical protein